MYLTFSFTRLDNSWEYQSFLGLLDVVIFYSGNKNDNMNDKFQENCCRHVQGCFGHRLIFSLTGKLIL